MDHPFRVVLIQISIQYTGFSGKLQAYFPPKRRVPRRKTGGGHPFSSAAAMAAARTTVSAGDGDLAGGYGHTVAHRDGHAHLLRQRHGAVGLVGTGDASNAGASLTSDRGAPQRRGGGKNHRRRDVYTLSTDLAASIDRAGGLLGLAGPKGLVLVRFINSQSKLPRFLEIGLSRGASEAAPAAPAAHREMQSILCACVSSGA